MLTSKSKTKKLPSGRKLLLVSLAILLLSGCSAQMATDVETLADVADFARTVPRVENSHRSPCWQQRQIAQNSAALDTAEQGKEVVYPVHPRCAIKEGTKKGGIKVINSGASS